MNHLFIIRGLPGSGKSTAGERLTPGHSYAADDWMVNEKGIYTFDPKKLGYCHEMCQKKVEEELTAGNNVSVCNTFTMMWEMAPYVGICLRTKSNWHIYKCVGEYQNIHDCPQASIDKMKSRWEDHPNELIYKPELMDTLDKLFG